MPQGFTLGLLLFLLYINHIIKLSQLLSFSIFADTNITYTDADRSSLTMTLNTEVIKISSWLLSNKLSLKVQKTNYLVFSGNSSFGDSY